MQAVHGEVEQTTEGLVHAGGQVWSISKKYIPLSKGSTMKNLSLKLEDDIFQETEKIVTKVKKNRNRYINEAIEFYNRLHRRRLLSKQGIKSRCQGLSGGFG
jgi:hypothetical protein